MGKGPRSQRGGPAGREAAAEEVGLGPGPWLVLSFQKTAASWGFGPSLRGAKRPSFQSSFQGAEVGPSGDFPLVCWARLDCLPRVTCPNGALGGLGEAQPVCSGMQTKLLSGRCTHGHSVQDIGVGVGGVIRGHTESS